MKLLIIRHAEPDYAHDSLTEKGFREAELLSEKLAQSSITDLYCSPMGRAQRTAKPTAEKCQLPVVTLPWLREFTGQMQDPDEPERKRIPWNLKPQFWTRQPELYDRQRWIENPFVKAGDVEQKYRDVTDSFDALLARYGCRRDGGIYHCEQNPVSTIALFCHFGLGMVLVSHLAGISPFLMWQNFFFPPSSVTAFITEERARGDLFFKCMQMGDTSHLYAAKEEPSHSGLYSEFYGGDGSGAQV